MKTQIVVQGVGGQGVVLVSRLLAESARIAGTPVFTYEIHGMSQRGGSVKAWVKLGPFRSPVVTGLGDILLCLYEPDLWGGLSLVRRDGLVLLNAAELPEGKLDAIRRGGFRFVLFDGDGEAKKRGVGRSSNLVMAREMIRHSDCVPVSAARSALEALIRDPISRAANMALFD